jgi:CheY-like chemotaxis protein
MKKRILFIDDEKIPTRYLVDALNDTGRYETIWVRTGDEALVKIAESKNFDLVFIDLLMPPSEEFGAVETKDGLACGVAIHDRLRIHLPHVPIFFFTNIRDKELLRPVIDRGWLAPLSKYDYPPAKLIAFVNDIISN